VRLFFDDISIFGAIVNIFRNIFSFFSALFVVDYALPALMPLRHYAERHYYYDVAITWNIITPRCEAFLMISKYWFSADDEATSFLVAMGPGLPCSRGFRLFLLRCITASKWVSLIIDFLFFFLLHADAAFLWWFLFQVVWFRRKYRMCRYVPSSSMPHFFVETFSSFHYFHASHSHRYFFASNIFAISITGSRGLMPMSFRLMPFSSSWLYFDALFSITFRFFFMLMIAIFID